MQNTYKPQVRGSGPQTPDCTLHCSFTESLVWWCGVQTMYLQYLLCSKNSIGHFNCLTSFISYNNPEIKSYHYLMDEETESQWHKVVWSKWHTEYVADGGFNSPLSTSETYRVSTSHVVELGWLWAGWRDAPLLRWLSLSRPHPKLWQYITLGH